MTSEHPPCGNPHVPNCPRVERTLLSAAFDLDFDFDFPSQETPRVPHPCAFCAQGWDTATPAARAFDVHVAFALARVEQTLLSAAFDFDVASALPDADGESTTGKGTTFSRAGAHAHRGRSALERLEKQAGVEQAFRPALKPIILNRGKARNKPSREAATEYRP